MSNCKLIVVSAVNLRKGGTLTILNDCLSALSEMAERNQVRVVALVHDRRLADYPSIEFIELPWAKRSWAHRLWCEYMTMHGISHRLGDIDLWLSLHDTTPRVKARRQAVYCHNSYPFFHWHWHHVWLNYRIVCFALFTKLYYLINLKRNSFVVVQSQWFRKAFAKMTGFGANKTIVFPPSTSFSSPSHSDTQVSPLPHPTPFTFLYPAYPDVHKNMECLCEASRLLEQEVGVNRFQVLLTTSPTANRYSRWLHRRWGNVKSLRFCGFMSKERLNKIYCDTDCLVFPSQVETWGLPISEFAVTGRPMLLADRPYAHETAAGSRCTAFFDADDPVTLKTLMHDVIKRKTDTFQHIGQKDIEPPFVRNWEQLISQLLQQ